MVQGRRVGLLDEAEVLRLYAELGAVKPVAKVLGVGFAKVASVLHGHGVGTGRVAVLDEGDVVARYLACRSVKQVATDLKTSAARVRGLLVEAGVELAERAPSAEEQRLVSGMYVAGRSYAEIGVVFGRSSNWVVRVLDSAGVQRRSPPKRQPEFPDTKIVELYVHERCSTTVIAKRTGLSPSGVFQILRRNNVVLRSRGEALLRLDEARLRVLFGEGKTVSEIAGLLGASTTGVASALVRLGLARVSVVLDAGRVGELYYQGCSDPEIAAELNVSVYAVSRFRRAEGIVRKWWDFPPPPVAELHARVEAAGSLVEVATLYRVPLGAVRRWCVEYGISYGHREGVDHEVKQHLLDSATLEHAYVDAGRSAESVAVELGVSKRLVLGALHRERLGVRPSGTGDPNRATVLIDELTADPMVRRVCKAFGVPLPPVGRVGLTNELVHSLYVNVGLSQLAVGLLTGQSESAVRNALVLAGISPRSLGRSPWRDRHPRGS